MLLFQLKADLGRIYELTGREQVVPTLGRVCWYSLHPRFAPVVLIRLATAFERWRLKPLGRLLSLVNFVAFGLEVTCQCEIGPGLLLPHTQGTVIGALRIGPGATIFQNVTLGAKELDYRFSNECRPVLGANVTIGSGAKVLGGLEIGDNTVVGANAVVLDSMPPNSVVGGIPAKVLKNRPPLFLHRRCEADASEPNAA